MDRVCSRREECMHPRQNPPLDIVQNMVGLWVVLVVNYVLITSVLSMLRQSICARIVAERSVCI